MLNGGEKEKSLTWRQGCFGAVKGEEGTLQGGGDLCLAAPSVEPLKKNNTKTIKSSGFPNGELPTQTGLPPPRRFWKSGEPNNVGQHGEDCATVSSRGLWNDATCSGAEAWICERSC